MKATNDQITLAAVEQNTELAASPSSAEIARMAAFVRRVREAPKPPKLSRKAGDDKDVTRIDNSCDYMALVEATGTIDGDLSGVFLDQAQRTVPYREMPKVDRCNIALAALHGIKPKDELEGMLAVQMVGTHNLAMTFMARAMLEGQTCDGVDANISRATKLMRTFTAQIEALNRYRGQGQQKVIVEHVHVNEGGQAIVGLIGEGGGVKHGKGG
ncbi:MAG: hypothetical protein WC683_03340 [bacterium]